MDPAGRMKHGHVKSKESEHDCVQTRSVVADEKIWCLFWLGYLKGRKLSIHLLTLIQHTLHKNEMDQD